MNARGIVEGATRLVRGVTCALMRRRDATTPPERAQDVGSSPPEQEPDAIEILIAEHRELDAWLTRVEQEPRSADTPALVDRIRTHLRAHVDAEEHTFYAHLREDIGNMGGLLDTSDGRHSTISQLLSVLEETDPSDAPTVTRVVAALRYEFHDDVRLEEESIFPQVRTALTVEHLTALGRMLEQQRQSLLASP
jgi:hemerythrin superfamily protein